MSKVYREIKDYISIFIFFVIIFVSFDGTMSFAATCSEESDFSKLDHCRKNAFTPNPLEYSTEDDWQKAIRGKIDVDGNLPITCSGINGETFVFNPYTSDDYYYDNHNRKCLDWGLGVSISYAATSVGMDFLCTSFVSSARTPTKLSKLSKLRKVFESLKIIGNGITQIGQNAAVATLTDPAIMLQLEFAVDSVTLIISMIANAAVGDFTALGRCAAALATITAMSQTLLWSTAGGIYESAKANINNVAICGDDWNSFAYTSSEMKNPRAEWYPEFGSFSNSYSYKLDKCFTYGAEMAKRDYNVDCSEIEDGDGICKAWKKGTYKDDNSSEFTDKLNCNGVTLTYRNIKNRAYRERLYKGKEFKISTDYTDSMKCHDPRLDSVKGFTGLEQRYYFRGRGAAEYACDRFKYQNAGCRLEDGTTITRAEALKDDDKNKQCKLAFENARSCCQSRRALGACIYDKKNNNRENNSLCLRTMDASQAPSACDLTIKTTVLVDQYGIPINFLDHKNVGDNNIREVVASSKKISFVAFSSQDNSNMICVKNTNFCPYAYNVMGGTVLEDLYCNGDYTNQADCDPQDYRAIWKENKYRYPTSAYGQPKNFCQYNAHCTEMGESQYEFADLTGNKFLPKVCSDFVGDSQNLPYPVRLADLSTGSLIKRGFDNIGKGKEIGSGSYEEMCNVIDGLTSEELVKLYGYVIGEKALVSLAAGLVGGAIGGPLAGVITAGATGSILATDPIIGKEVNADIGNAKESLKAIINQIVNKPIIKGVDFSLGEYRGFTAPIAQCFKETLNNMFHNKAGQSFCLNNKTINSEGLCGKDTFGPPEIITRDDYLYVIGEDLPEDSNIFFKIQSRVQNLIKLVAVIALMVIAIKFMIKGDMDLFSDVKKPKAMIVGLLKFAIVFYFSVGNAWQGTFYDWIDKSTQWLYYKSFNLSLLGYGNYKNQASGKICTITTKTEETRTIEKLVCQEASDDSAQVIATYDEPGTYNYKVPSGVNTIKIDVYGGSGGDSRPLQETIKGGNGGHTYGRLMVNDGDQFTIVVGGAAVGKIGGSNGGGTGVETDRGVILTYTDSMLGDICLPAGGMYVFGGGGGRSEISKNGILLLVAGGGGGATPQKEGGVGGGGSNPGGYGADAKDYGGGGGIVAAAGSMPMTSGFGDFFNKGQILNGGNSKCQKTFYGEGEHCKDMVSNETCGGAGGGGYGGGSSGSFYKYEAGGGGGAGYINQSYITNGGGESGVHTGDGKVVISVLNKICTSTEETVTNNYEDTKYNQEVEEEELKAELKVEKLPDYNTEVCKEKVVNGNKTIQECYTACNELTKYDENGYPLYEYSETYDGCYFGDNVYPQGKEYLAIFDSLDCKLMNYLGYGPEVSLPGILHMLLISLFWSPLALVTICLGTFIFVILISIVIRILYIFLMSMIAINIMIYVSPIIFPTMLFEKYKGIFSKWLDNMMGFCLQLIFTIIFSGFLIGTLERFTIGSARYVNHDPATGRLPTIVCGDSVDSILCIFKVNVNKGTEPVFGEKIGKFLGIGPVVSVIESISRDFVTTVMTMLNFCLIMFVLLQFVKKIPEVASELVGGATLTGKDISVMGTMGKIAKGSDAVLRGAKGGLIKAAGSLRNLPKGKKKNKPAANDTQRRPDGSDTGKNGTLTGLSAREGEPAKAASEGNATLNRVNVREGGSQGGSDE